MLFGQVNASVSQMTPLKVSNGFSTIFLCVLAMYTREHAWMITKLRVVVESFESNFLLLKKPENLRK